MVRAGKNIPICFRIICPKWELVKGKLVHQKIWKCSFNDAPTHFIYGYMASDVWYRITQIVRDETRCCHFICHPFQVAARAVLYAPSHRLDSCTIIRYRCHYTKSNPIDDHSNISSKTLQMQNFKPLGHYTCMQCGTSSPRKHTVTHHFSDLHEVYSGNRQIHTKCQLQYLHPTQISTSGKCHCVIIHQTTKSTEYIG